MSLRQAALQAILLCRWIDETPHQRGSINGMAAQTRHALEQALAEPEQEPVAWMTPTGAVYRTEDVDGCFDYTHIPLYAAPTPRKPLTYDELEPLCEAFDSYDTTQNELVEFARAIERAHGIGEQT